MDRFGWGCGRLSIRFARLAVRGWGIVVDLLSVGCFVVDSLGLLWFVELVAVVNVVVD